MRKSPISTLLILVGILILTISLFKITNNALAQGGSECSQDPSCVLLEGNDVSNSGSWNNPQYPECTIDHIFFEGGNPKDNEDKRLDVEWWVTNGTLHWSYEGPPDISHIEIYLTCNTPTPDPTETPIPSETPQDPTETPEPSDTPEPTETPQDPTETPEDPTETPVVTETPQDPTETPQDPTETPKPTKTPKDKETGPGDNNVGIWILIAAFGIGLITIPSLLNKQKA